MPVSVTELHTDNYHAKGPYIVWHNYGFEGWQPRSYDSFENSFKSKGEEDVITKIVDVIEASLPKHDIAVIV